MKKAGTIKVKNESNEIQELVVYHGDPIATGTFSNPNDVSVDVFYFTSSRLAVDPVDNQTFKVRDTGEILRKI